MNTQFDELRDDPDMQDSEYRHAWATSHLNSMIAMQIKVLREQRKWTQGTLAKNAEMAQPRISLIEDVNYSAWSINTLKKIARAYDLRLKVSFEEFGSIESELVNSGRGAFERRSFPDDPKFGSTGYETGEQKSDTLLDFDAPDSQKWLREALNNMASPLMKRRPQTSKRQKLIPLNQIPLPFPENEFICEASDMDTDDAFKLIART